MRGAACPGPQDIGDPPINAKTSTAIFFVKSSAFRRSRPRGSVCGKIPKRNFFDPRKALIRKEKIQILQKL